MAVQKVTISISPRVHAYLEWVGKKYGFHVSRSAVIEKILNDSADRDGFDVVRKSPTLPMDMSNG